MKVEWAKFVISAARSVQFPDDGRPEVAFAGRSNVGKSTLLNILLKKKGLAKTSGTPGKTRLVNFFDINGAVYFVDLPGYGYARVSSKMRGRWADSITSYLTDRAPLRLVCHLLDARHKPTRQDFEMLDLLEHAQIPTLVVATKFDKVKPSQRKRAVRELYGHLDFDDDALLVPYSSVTKDGLVDLWHAIDDALA